MLRATAALLLVALAGCSGEDGTKTAEPANVAHAGGAAPPPAKAAAPAPTPPPATAPGTGTAPMSPTGYALVGSEPFWGGTVTGTSVRYMVPERQFGDVVETRRSYGPGSETYRGAFRGRPFVLTIARGPCSDGMSDRAHAFIATLQVLGETRRGCADPEELQPRP